MKEIAQVFSGRKDEFTKEKEKDNVDRLKVSL
jgi:hypothetical protein